MTPKVFLGKAEVKSEVVEGNFITAVLADETTIRLHKDLYAILKTSEEVDLEIADLKYSAIAKMFIAQLMAYDLRSVEVDDVTRYMSNHVSNAHNGATKKLWGGKGVNSVTLQDIFHVLEV